MTKYLQPDGQEKPLKWYKSLHSTRNRIAAGAFLVEGERAIRQISQRNRDEIMEILALSHMTDGFPGIPLHVLNEKQIASISQTKTPQGVIAAVHLPKNTYSEQLPADTGGKILLLEDVQDPGNTGTLIRTASAFDFCGVILSDKCADPFSYKVVQSSAGALLSLWIRRSGHYLELVKQLLARGYTLTAADLAGRQSPAVISQHEKLILALGNEASGLSKSLLRLAHLRVSIGINREKAESLNVAACGAILMYLASAKVLTS